MERASLGLCPLLLTTEPIYFGDLPRPSHVPVLMLTLVQAPITVPARTGWVLTTGPVTALAPLRERLVQQQAHNPGQASKIPPLKFSPRDAFRSETGKI